MAKRCQALAQHKEIQLSIHNHLNEDALEEIYFILIDSFKMEQVLRNLIVNAIKFTPTKGRIDIHLR